MGGILPEENKCGEPMMAKATRVVDSKPGTVDREKNVSFPVTFCILILRPKLIVEHIRFMKHITRLRW